MSGKQYVLVVEEDGLEVLGRVCGGWLRLMEIQGMDVGVNNACKILCTPVQPPVPPMSREIINPVEEGEHVG